LVFDRKSSVNLILILTTKTFSFYHITPPSTKMSLAVQQSTNKMNGSHDQPEETPECMICCNSVKQLITCINYKCKFISCKNCYKKYLLDNSTQTKCMDCNVEFDHDVLVKFFGRSFVMGQLRKSQKRVLLEQQLSQMPITQLSNEFQRESISHKLSIANKELKIVRNEVLNRNNQYSFQEKHTMIWEKKYNVLKFRNMLNILPLNNKTTSPIKNTFIIKCDNLECKGFVNSRYICDICETTYCNQCLEKKTLGETDEHVCKQEDVDTAKLILKESKPCPSCGTRISKISGCDQMWCTQCHITFSWTNGTITKGNVHNPHYFEWMRTNNHLRPVVRNPGDIHCGGLVGFEFILRYLNHYAIQANEIIFYYQDISHIIHVEIVSIRQRLVHMENEAYMLKKRIHYLLGKITDKGLESSATRRAYRIQRDRKCLQLYEVVSMVGIEEINDMNDKFHNVSDNKELCENEKKQKCFEIVNLVLIKIKNVFDYFNEQSKHIETNFKCKVGQLPFYTTANPVNEHVFSDDDDD
jgi:hypothetical protein